MFQHGAARHTDASRAATTRPSRSPAPAFARLPHQLRSPRPPDLTRQSTPTSLTAWLLAGRSPDTWHLLGSSPGIKFTHYTDMHAVTRTDITTCTAPPRKSHASLVLPALPPLPRPLHSKSPFASPLLSLPITVSTLPLLHPLRHRLIWSHHRITSRLAHAHTPLCVPRIQS